MNSWIEFGSFNHFKCIVSSGELTEMMGDLFTGHDMPEPPKESFFKGLFGGGSRSLDREELCKFNFVICYLCIYLLIEWVWIQYVQAIMYKIRNKQN